MDDAELVRGFEGIGNLPGDREGVGDGNRSASDDDREVLPLDQLHHQRADCGRLLEPIDLRDVGVIEHRERLCFPRETGEPIGIEREELRQDLDRDAAIQLRIAGAIHDAHSAFPQRRRRFHTARASCLVRDSPQTSHQVQR